MFMNWRVLMPPVAALVVCASTGVMRASAAESLRPQADIAAAQGARMTGTITDTTGAVLPGITLVISGPALAEPKMVVTDAMGRFEIAGLPAGRVSVTCTAPGFVQWRREGVEVKPGAPATVNVVMRRVVQVVVDGAPDPAAPGPPTPAPPPSADELLDQIDRFLEQLPEASIAFNAPESMLAGDTTEMHLLLSPKLSVEALEDKLKGLGGDVQGDVIRVAPRMEAVLTGQNFEIVAITPALQAVARNEPTEWRWEVTPKAAGSHRLHLVLNAAVEGSSRTLRTFDRTIQVNVTWGRQLSGFAQNNWQWLWTTALVPVAGWLWKRRRTARSTPDQSAIGR
jgi:hypothetical protein